MQVLITSEQHKRIVMVYMRVSQNIPLNTGGISRHLSRISVKWGIPSWYIADIFRETFVTP